MEIHDILEALYFVRHELLIEEIDRTYILIDFRNNFHHWYPIENLQQNYHEILRTGRPIYYPELYN